MKEKLGLYHFTAIAIVAVWGLTYISTKVLMQNGLQPQEIFFYRFLIAFMGRWFHVFLHRKYGYRHDSGI